jgi:hypothetical protein
MSSRAIRSSFGNSTGLVEAFDVMCRGYLDFSRLYTMHRAGAFFVARAKHRHGRPARLFGYQRPELAYFGQPMLLEFPRRISVITARLTARTPCD